MSTKLIASTLIGTGVIGGGSAGAYYLLNRKEEEPKSLRQLLISEKKTPLALTGTTDDGDWEKLVEKFLDTKKPVTVTKINAVGITAATSGTGDNKKANIAKLQEACKALLEKTKDYSTDKEVAINWCTKASPLLTTG